MTYKFLIDIEHLNNPNKSFFQNVNSTIQSVLIQRIIKDNIISEIAQHIIITYSEKEIKILFHRLKYLSEVYDNLFTEYELINIKKLIDKLRIFK